MSEKQYSNGDDCPLREPVHRFYAVNAMVVPQGGSVSMD
jgi:hypothetical protein